MPFQQFVERRFPVFRTGVHTDSQGQIRTWTPEDLARIAETYNPALHEAPAVIGHPETNAPAWGWVKGLDVTGDTLNATAELVPEFEEMVKKGLFKKRSISLYPDGSLRHVGFLGAQPPAVKGLPDIAFVEGEATTIELSEFAASSEGGHSSRKTDGGHSSEEQEARGVSPNNRGGMSPAVSPAHEAQRARAEKWGISPHQGGNVTKPGEWADVPDDEFLDPVNYAYPVPDAERTRSAASYWGRQRDKDQYTKAEQGIIDRRLDEARKRFDIGANAEGGHTSSSHSAGGGMSLATMGGKTMKFFEWIKQAATREGITLDDLPASGQGAFSEADVEAARKVEREKARQEFAESQKAKEDALKAREEKLRAQEAEARRTGVAAFCEGLEKEGRLTPAMMKVGMGMTNFLESIGSIETPIEFGETNERKRQTPLEFMQTFLTGLPKSIEFREFASSEKDPGAGDDDAK